MKTMKRFYPIIFVLAAFALATTACDIADVDDKDAGGLSGKPMVLHATLAESQATKTAVQADGTSVWWNAGDQINVFNGSSYKGKFTSLNREPAASADFGGSLNLVEGATAAPAATYWAVYPYNDANTCDGESVTLSLTESQYSDADSFGDNLFPAIARSSDLDMHFYNVCGGVCFSVVRENIRAVTFKSNGGERLAGTMKVSFGTGGYPEVQSVTDGVDQVTVYPTGGGTFVPGKKYYAVMIPQTLSSGLKVTYRTENQMASLSFERSLSFPRSTFAVFSANDAYLTFEDAPVDGTAFPDKSFRTYVFRNFDTDGDGLLSETERERVSSIEVCTDTIATLKGIEYFPNLDYLYCRGTRKYNNQTYAYEYYSILTALDVRANTALKILYCYYNPLLTELDVTNNTQLVSLDLGADGLTALDVSHCPDLQNLSCWGNALSTLDVTNNRALTSLSCETNQLSSLDVRNNTKLTWLSCGSNKLSSLDVSQNTLLESLNCPSNQLTSLNLSANTELTYLSCSGNRLTGLDVSMLSKMKSLYVYNNTQLGTLDVTHNPRLTDLDCESTGITTLDLSQNPLLSYLYCGGNNIETIDLSNNPDLHSLYAYSMKLKVLDLSSQTKLMYLGCTDNPMTNLYVVVGQTFDQFDIPDGVKVSTKAQSWSVTGAFNGWAEDLDMTEKTPGVWVSPSFTCTGDQYGGFKLRQDHNWVINLGGDFAEYGTPFNAIRDSDNVRLAEEARIIVTLNVTDPLNPTITVTKDETSFFVTPSNVKIGADGGTFTVQVTSPNGGYHIENIPAWITQKSVENNVHTFEAAANTDASERNGIISFCDDQGTCLGVMVKQRGYSSFDWEKAFYHQSVAMRFTATWCGWCPRMNKSIAKAMTDYPGKIQPIALHGGGSNLEFESVSPLQTQYAITGFPSGIIDGRTLIENYSIDYTASLIVAAAKETENTYGTVSGIEIASTLNGRALTVDVNAYIKQAGSYKITILLLEDGIVGYQADYEDEAHQDYVHDNVARKALTDVTGEAFTAEAQSVHPFQKTVTIPNDYNIDNIRILVYVQASFDGKTKIQTADYGNYYVDNCATVAVGGSLPVAFVE